jgi:hypothetical protein
MVQVACLRASFAVILLTGLTVYIYSIVGMNTFGSFPTDEVLARAGIPEDAWEDLRGSEELFATVCPLCSNYNDFTNFLDFGHAFRLLIQQAFGQGITGIVGDLTALGANFWVAFVFFASFYMLSVWIFMNLLIVTVLSNFDLANTSHGDEAPILPHDLEGFAHTWAALATGESVIECWYPSERAQ